MQTLKDELFVLETERIQGGVTAEEYDRQRAAIEIVLKRALERSQSTTGTAVV